MHFRVTVLILTQKDYTKKGEISCLYMTKLMHSIKGCFNMFVIRLTDPHLDMLLVPTLKMNWYAIR